MRFTLIALLVSFAANAGFVKGHFTKNGRYVKPYLRKNTYHVCKKKLKRKNEDYKCP